MIAIVLQNTLLTIRPLPDRPKTALLRPATVKRRGKQQKVPVSCPKAALDSPEIALALLSVCRQLRQESQPLVWANVNVNLSKEVGRYAAGDFEGIEKLGNIQHHIHTLSMPISTWHESFDTITEDGLFPELKRLILWDVDASDTLTVADIPSHCSIEPESFQEDSDADEDADPFNDYLRECIYEDPTLQEFLLTRPIHVKVVLHTLITTRTACQVTIEAGKSDVRTQVLKWKDSLMPAYAMKSLPIKKTANHRLSSTSKLGGMTARPYPP